jgi:K+-transporting ATPase KdpF subunit
MTLRRRYRELFCLWRIHHMGFDLVLGGIVALALLVYLLAVLIRPDRF